MITKADEYLINNLKNILQNGAGDANPRPHWQDGTKAYTISVNHVLDSYNLITESPFVTLRPITYKNAIKEIFWIYQDASNDLDLLKDKYGISWWDEWDIGNRTIGCVYGETVRRHNLMNKLLDGLEKDPFGRRHIMSLWQEDDFENPYGLPPCCFETIWNVHELIPNGIRYLDMTLIQRSSDYVVSGNINELQYISLMYMVAGHLSTVTDFTYIPDKFSHYTVNQHIYDRHIESAKEIIARKPIEFDNNYPKFEVESKYFYDYQPEDIVVVNYPLDKIKEQNPQIKFEIAI